MLVVVAAEAVLLVPALCVRVSIAVMGETGRVLLSSEIGKIQGTTEKRINI